MLPSDPGRGVVLLDEFQRADGSFRDGLADRRAGKMADAQLRMLDNEGVQPRQPSPAVWNPPELQALRRTFGEIDSRTRFVGLVIGVKFQTVTVSGLRSHLKRIS